MVTLEILRYPDPRLYTKAEPVDEVDDSVRALVRDMAETMYAAPGVGLAATQVNVHKRIVVIDASESRDQLLVLINPEIVARDGAQYCEEGCLSVPGIYEAVERAERVTVSALGIEGKVFVDYLSRLKQQRIKAKLQKQIRKTA